jgi:hypothetical protein
MDTVTAIPGTKEVLHMGVAGYVIALGVLLLLLPVLPLIVILWLFSSDRNED